MINKKKNISKISQADKFEKQEYLPPEVITYSSEEILEALGPATACVTPVFGPAKHGGGGGGF